MALKEELEFVDESLALLASQKGIGKSFFKYPESVHVEASSRSQNIKLQEAFAANSLFMAVIQEGWRFRTIARMSGSYILPHFGKIHWIEIAEPAQENATKVSTVPRVKALSFYTDYLGDIHDTLKARQIVPKEEDNGFSVDLRGLGTKVIFTDIGIDYSIEQYVENGTAFQVQLDPR